MAEVTEVVTKFSFTGSIAPLGKYNKSLGKAVKGLGALAAATGAAVAGAAVWGDRILKTIDPIAQLNRETGVAVETIQALSFASSVNGGSAEAMRASLQKLGAVIGEVSIGTGMGKLIFEEYGIDVFDAAGKVKDAGQIFDELRQKIVELDLDNAQVQGIAKKLGLNPAMVQLLTKTNQEMDELNQESKALGELTLEQIDATADYNDALTRMNTAMDRVKQQIAVGFAPEMKKLADSVTGFVIENKEFITTLTTGSIQVLVGVAKAFVNVTKEVASLVGWMLQSRIVAGFLAAGVVALVATFFPITGIVAIITGLVLIVDDLIVGFKGGQSVILSFFEGFNALDPILNSLRWMKDLLGAIFSFNFAAIGRLFNGGSFFDHDAARSAAVNAGSTNNSSVDNRQTTTNITQNIQTSDPERAGRIATEGFQKQLRDTAAQSRRSGL